MCYPHEKDQNGQLSKVLNLANSLGEAKNGSTATLLHTNSATLERLRILNSVTFVEEAHTETIRAPATEQLDWK
jgi:hypothetical protein